MVVVNAPIRESLHSRRRRETRREIQRAALRLAREHGFDKLTVDMISAEAGVSPRTFFNYFPSKDAAVLHGPTDLSEELVAQFVAAGPASAREVLSDLTRLLVRDLAGRPPDPEELRASFEVSRKNPPVLAALLAQFEAFQTYVADLAARRLGENPGDEVSAMIAAIALAAVRQGMDQWARSETDAAPISYVERSMELLYALVAAGPESPRPNDG